MHHRLFVSMRHQFICFGSTEPEHCSKWVKRREGHCRPLRKAMQVQRSL